MDNEYITKNLREMYEKIRCGKQIIIYNLADTELLDKLLKLLILKTETVEIWSSVKSCVNGDLLHVTSRDGLKDVIRMYKTYEFTDKIIIVSDDNNYPCIYNYVKQKVITEEEMIEAILSKIG